jgi:phosphatidate cytidylyltransferase
MVIKNAGSNIGAKISFYSKPIKHLFIYLVNKIQTNLFYFCRNIYISSMALNIKTLGTRALSALIFVLVLLGCLIWNYYSFSIFFFAVAMLGLNEFYKLSEKLNALPYKFTGFLAAALSYCSFINTDFIACHPNPLLPMLVVLPFLIFLVALFNKRDNPILNVMYTIGGIIYSVLPFALLHNIVIRRVAEENSFDYYPYMLMGVIILIWSNDTFAYLGGSLFGRHKMIERISPGKTWEGTIFGVLITIILGYIIGKYFMGEIVLWILLGIMVPILATVGDLVESMLKRQAGIKDTGNIMPGHGGILDRFDSLIFVTPFVFVILKLL